SCSSSASVTSSAIFAFVYFSLYYYCDHPDLHSFPTRRSSDLGAPGSGTYVNAEQILEVHGLSMDDIDAQNLDFGESTGGIQILRSEEHTSELQSRFDLVCRLLLEKKNKLPTTRTYTSCTDSSH